MNHSPEHLQMMHERYHANRQKLLDAINNLPALDDLKPEHFENLESVFEDFMAALDFWAN